MEQAILLIQDLAGAIRGAQLWFHGAHHLTAGAGFAGDHEQLYGNAYKTLENQFDDLVEHGIGALQDDMIGCPKELTARANGFLQKYPSPAELDDASLASTALNISRDIRGLVEQTYYDMELQGTLGLGFQDLLPGLASAQDQLIYHLSRRSRSSSQWGAASNEFSQIAMPEMGLKEADPGQPLPEQVQPPMPPSRQRNPVQ